MKSVKLTKVDVKLIAKDDTIYLFDIKTAKPNAGNFKEFKRTLLQWVAATLAIIQMQMSNLLLQYLINLITHSRTIDGQ